MPEDDSDMSLIVWSVRYISGLHCEQHCVQLQLHKKTPQPNNTELVVKIVFK